MIEPTQSSVIEKFIFYPEDLSEKSFLKTTATAFPFFLRIGLLGIPYGVYKLYCLATKKVTSEEIPSVAARVGKAASPTLGSTPPVSAAAAAFTPSVISLPSQIDMQLVQTPPTLPELLVSFGITLPQENTDAEERKQMLEEAEKQLQNINLSIPSKKEVSFDETTLKTLLQTAYDYSLNWALGKLVLGEKFHDSSIPLEDRAKIIREWLLTPDAQQLFVLKCQNILCFPKELCILKQLKKLTIAVNHIKALPAEISNLTNLEELNLSYNQLSTLPSGIKNLSHLRLLFLGGNIFSSFPAELLELTSLTKLVFFDNNLKAIPREIGKLWQLEELYLGGNPLTELPTEIEYLPKLKFLSLVNCSKSLTQPARNLIARLEKKCRVAT